MIKIVLYILASGILLISCTREKEVSKAREHTQNVVKNIYSDTVFAYLQSKYLPADEIRELIEQFRTQYKAGTLRGSLVREQYYKNLSGNDEITFLHRYKSDKKMVKIQMTYELMNDTFMVKSMLIHNSFIQ